MISILIFLTIIIIGLCIGCYNLILQLEKTEDLLMSYQTKVSEIRELALKTEIELKELDLKGAFESDDEVGTTFKNIKLISNELTTFITDFYDDRD